MISIVFSEGSVPHPRVGELVDGPFEIVEDEDSRSLAYPRVLIARPWSMGEEGGCEGPWRLVDAYPDPACDDEHGWKALDHGAWFYGQAMTYGDPKQRSLRIDCFRAAEILYLHAAEKGNAQALVDLGYVYSYNRCEGMFWPGWEKYDEGDFSDYPADERAYQVLLEASESDFSEAHYKLGDMLSSGRGCEQDHARAYECYKKAYERAEYEYSHIKGSCAFRLAKAHEEGRGCQQSFELALHYYQEAEFYLDRAVSCGDYYYRKAFFKAQRGIRRMRQEISGQY